MTPFISIIIPNHNGEKTIGLSLEAALASEYSNYEVIVVDDCSSDNSIELIEKYPCRLIRLANHGGASMARNTGAQNSRGELLFFIDADCLLQPDTLEKAAVAYRHFPTGVVIGGTYTLKPYDRIFFSTVQSVFIHYSETKNCSNPDYIATHAMLIPKELFLQSGGFSEEFLPIIEDVDYSHRLKKNGVRLVMAPDIQVQHIFNFTLGKSLRNGFRKAKYWTIYSLKNKDLLADSGTASREFKFNVLSCFINLLLLLTGFLLKLWLFVPPVALLFVCNLYLNRKLIQAFRDAAGPLFAISALLYYTCIYPFAVGLGAFSGTFRYKLGLQP